VQQSDRMLAKMKELNAANTKLQSKIDSQTGELTKAKEAGGAAAAELQTKLQTQEVLIAELQMQVKYSGLLHEAFLKGMGMRMGAPFASPASSASTATPPPPGAGSVNGFHMAGMD
tara:strand:- start:225 stop:572 length:348 start_codon:yes stop_codon:yes gene_type:complete